MTPFNAKAMALFPERIGGKLAAILTIETRRWTLAGQQVGGSNQTAQGILGQPQIRHRGEPLEAQHGWLLFFHRVTQSGALYKVEAVLLDRDEPSKVIAETGATLLEPETTEERFGLTPNVVFPCGAVILDGYVWLYYGGADSVICLARMSLECVYKRLGL